MTKHFIRSPSRLSVRHERWIYGAAAALSITGVGWLTDHYLFATAEESGRGHYEGLWLKLHGAAGMIGLIVLGSLFPTHIARVLQSRRNRGIYLLSAVGVLLITSYLLYYVGNEETRSWVSFIHWALGLVLPLTLASHVILAKRRPPATGRNESGPRTMDELLHP